MLTHTPTVVDLSLLLAHVDFDAMREQEDVQGSQEPVVLANFNCVLVKEIQDLLAFGLVISNFSCMHYVFMILDSH